jgi:uncharacterized protein YihD (DUF1040 family)
MGVSFFQKPYQIIKDVEIKDLLAKMNEQSKDIAIPYFSDDYQEDENITFSTIIPIIHQQERIVTPSTIPQREKVIA